MQNKMKAYVNSRWTNVLEPLSRDAGIPTKPTVTYLGRAGFPTDDLRFRSSTFADPNGNDTFGAMEWRIAEVTNPSAPGYDPRAPKKYEINADWESGELTMFNGEVKVPSNVVDPGKTYRVRVRFKDNTGRWSNWSDAAQFVAGTPDASVKDSLRITELHYHPAPNPAGPTAEDEFEFIELQNTGAAPIELAGVHFTNGLDYTFGASVLQPGQYVVVAVNRDAFVQRYGTAGINLADGVFTGHLDNTGERIRLLDANDQPIFDFIYSDQWYASTDGDGPSMVVKNAEGDVAALGDAASWRPSFVTGGSPGKADTQQNDTTPPTADVGDVTPDPRHAPVDTMTIVFSEPVTGFDLSDLMLHGPGGEDVLTASQTLTTTDNVTWTLGNLAGITAAPGTYMLMFLPQSGIRDAAGNAMTALPEDSWTVLPLLTADIVDVSPDPRRGPVDSIQIAFSAPVTGFDLSDLRLTREGTQDDLLTAAQSLSSPDGGTTWILDNLGPVTSAAGLYALTLRSNGGISDGAGGSLAGNVTDGWTNLPSVFVTGQSVFYNRSAYDGNNAGIDAADANAIATEKQALLPGSAASNANFTNYSRGINGIMVDLSGRGGGPALGLEDFTFRIGADPSDPASFVDAPAPSAMDVKHAGAVPQVGGPERVTFVWNDGAIRNTWLQVTVKANDQTALAAPVLFYFGNLIGDTGDGTTSALVNALDLAGVKRALNAAADIASRFDFDRSGRVNALDLATVKANLNRTLALQPFAAGAASAPAPAARDWDESAGDPLGLLP